MKECPVQQDILFHPFLFIGQGSVLGIPVPVIIMLTVVLIAHLFLEKNNVRSFLLYDWWESRSC